MNLIDTFLPEYRELNAITANVIRNSWISNEEQIAITEFYRNYSDVKIFEQILLDIIQKQESEARSLLLSGIESAINQNINLYKTAIKKLASIDITRIYREKDKSFHEFIDKQLKITNAVNKELNNVNKSLEHIIYKEYTENEEDKLWKDHEYLTKEYKKEKEKLSILYGQQQEFRNEFSKYSENLFSKIYGLSLSFLSVLNSYNLAKEQSQERKEEKIRKNEKKVFNENGLYLDMKYVAIAHGECNDKQFEKLSEVELYSILNLQPINIEPTTKEGEIMRMGYLVRKLHENLKKDLNHHEKKKWLTSILNAFDIKETVYEKRCIETGLKDMSPKSEKFVQRINELFN